MKLIIVGTGRMGQLIRQKAEDAGHEVLAMGDVLSPGDVPALSAKADAIIDFSHPDNLDWILSLSGSAALVEGTPGSIPHTQSGFGQPQSPALCFMLRTIRSAWLFCRNSRLMRRKCSGALISKSWRRITTGKQMHPAAQRCRCWML